MQNMLKSKVFWTATVVVAAIILIVSLNTGKMYRGETDILFVPKSEKAVKNSDQILANAEALPKSLSFYDKLLELNPDISDPSSGQTDENRKNFWGAEISSKRLDGSGIVRIGALSSDQTQAEVLSQRTAADVIAVMSRYYDTKLDLDMRVIDGPIVFSVNTNRTATWIVLSILLGIVVGMIAYLFSTLTKNVVPKSILAKPAIFGQEKISYPEEKVSKNIFTPVEEVPCFALNKKADAPANLPIGDEIMPETGAQIEESEAVATEEEIAKTHEATAEEVRARLNKLLGGGM